MKDYRPEIDGLRALAVVPVIFFHAGFGQFGGGFVGVDVFFVISGYLITTILLQDQANGTFSLAKFYERRARRILPALFVVIAACLPFAWAWLLPEDRKAFADSVVAVCLFASNILFWQESGYFGAAVELKPLLHTWSLAIEEQYYLLFPLYLMVLWKTGKGRWAASGLIVTALVSLAAAQWAVQHKPIAAFFLLPSRAWELLLGALCAFYLQSHPEKPLRGWVRDASAAAGLSAIAYAIAIFDKHTPTPSLYTLVPTVGTAMIIIFATHDGWVGRLLGNRVLVGIGLISYSAYLWHQPLFAFARHRSIEEPTPAMFVVLSGVAMVLAYFTWRYVETPFRNRQWIGAPRVFKYSALSLVAFGVAGAVGGSLVKDAPSVEFTNGRCNFDAGNCFGGQKEGFRVALWGDSFADAFSRSLAARLAKEDITLSLFIKQSCPSILGTRRNESRMGPRFTQECTQHNLNALKQIKGAKFDYVVLTSAYQWYLTGKNDKGEPVLVDAQQPGLDPGQFLSGRLGETIAALSEGGARVLLVLPHPTLKDFRRTRKELFFGHVDQAYADYGQAVDARNALVADLARLDFDHIDGTSLFCSNGVCPVVDENKSLLLFDGSHISSVMAKRLADDIATSVLARRKARASAQQMVSGNRRTP